MSRESCDDQKKVQPAIGVRGTPTSIPRKSMEQLQNYSWPGNVRELNNVIERAMILSTGPGLLIEVPTLADPELRLTLSEGMRDQILRVLQQTGWRIRGAGQCSHRRRTPAHGEAGAMKANDCESIRSAVTQCRAARQRGCRAPRGTVCDPLSANGDD